MDDRVQLKVDLPRPDGKAGMAVQIPQQYGMKDPISSQKCQNDVILFCGFFNSNM